MTVLLMHLGEAHPLTLDRDHPASCYGHSVLLRKDGDIVDGALFRHLRDGGDAIIRTDEPERVVRALGVPEEEPGILPL